MNKKNILSLISRLPIWLNKIILKCNSSPALIFGRHYKEIFDNFERDSQSDFINFFNNMLSTSKYYSGEYGTDFKVTSISDFKKNVKFIDKDIVLSSFDSICSSDRAGADFCTTGGTSGKPLKILLPQSRFSNELGALHALWAKIGYAFSVRAVVRNERLGGQDFLINPITKEFIFDGYRTDDAYLSLLYSVMKKYEIPFYHGYTSNAERFVNFLLRENLEYDFLKGIITSSENLYPHQISLFKKLKNVAHMNFFGHSEKLILGGWCESGNCYHFYSSYGYVELIDAQGADVSDVGAVGELVGSTNYNAYMPLFRYRTGDYARKAPDACSGCGFVGLSAYEIYGRWSGERIFNKDGTFVTTTALNLHSDIYEHIDALQYYQPAQGVLEVRVIPSATYGPAVERRLLEDISNKLNDDSVVSVVEVEHVQKHANGKYAVLISDLDE